MKDLSNYTWKEIREQKLTGVWRRFRSSGQLEHEYNFKDGKPHGVSRRWYENAHLAYEGNYKDGKEHGVERIWNDECQLIYEGNFKDGNRHGVERIWDDKGRIEIKQKTSKIKQHLTVLILLGVLFSIISFIFSPRAHSDLKTVDCVKNKIYCKLKKLQPLLSDKEAMRDSNLIYKYSKKYNVDPNISLAICMVETECLNKNRTRKAIVYDNGKPVVSEVITDVGMFQLHVNTIKYLGLDLIRILGDRAYYIEQHIKILAAKIKVCSKRYGLTAWACYHSKTPYHHYIYFNKGKRYL